MDSGEYITIHHQNKLERKTMRANFAVLAYWVLWTVIQTLAKLISMEEYVGPIWLVTFALTFKYFLVFVPEVCGLVTINMAMSLFRGIVPKWQNDPLYNLKVYLTGVHFRYPWEQVKMGNYINLRLKTRSYEGETYPSDDGPLMKIDWSFQFTPRPELLARYIYIGISTISEGLHDVGAAFLSRKMKKMSAEDIKKGQKKLESGMRSYFEKTMHKVDSPGLVQAVKRLCGRDDIEGTTELPLELFYAVDIAKISIADADYPIGYQKVLESIARADKLKEIAGKLKVGDLGEKEALEAAMVINGDITKEITENIQGIRGQGAEAIANFILSLGSKGGEK